MVKLTNVPSLLSGPPGDLPGGRLLETKKQRVCDGDLVAQRVPFRIFGDPLPYPHKPIFSNVLWSACHWNVTRLSETCDWTLWGTRTWSISNQAGIHAWKLACWGLSMIAMEFLIAFMMYYAVCTSIQNTPHGRISYRGERWVCIPCMYVRCACRPNVETWGIFRAKMYIVLLHRQKEYLHQIIFSFLQAELGGQNTNG